MSKADALQAALSQNKNHRPSAHDAAEAAAPMARGQAARRAKQANISAWLSADYQTSLRLVHAKTGRKKQALIAEALNDLFAKHDVPQIREDHSQVD